MKDPYWDARDVRIFGLLAIASGAGIGVSLYIGSAMLLTFAILVFGFAVSRVWVATRTD